MRHATVRQWAVLLVLAFGLNIVWEFSQRPLYLSYQSGPVMDVILTRAAVWDAAYIALLVWLYRRLPMAQQKTWLFIIAAVVLAVIIEFWAQSTGRWVYSEFMPLVPWLRVGLAPTLQLAVTGYVAMRLAFKRPVK